MVPLVISPIKPPTLLPVPVAVPLLLLFFMLEYPTYPASVPTRLIPVTFPPMICTFSRSPYVIIPINPPVSSLLFVTVISFPITFLSSILSAILVSAPTSVSFLSMLLPSIFKFSI